LPLVVKFTAISGHSKITQEIKRAYERSPNWSILGDDQREALEMVAHKIGRIRQFRLCRAVVSNGVKPDYR
jgi:hypothetical protein